MSDLHPEELHDRYREGDLVAENLERYEDHLEHCEGCALERHLWDDFETYLAPRDDDEARIDRLVAGALEQNEEDAPPMPSRRSARRRMAAAIALTGVLAAGVAAAAWSELGIGRRETPAAPLQPAIPRTFELAPKGKGEKAASPEQPVDEPSKTSVPNAAPATAAELFSSANAARRTGSYDEAIARYRELQQRYPESREAKASQLILGRLLLERSNDPQAALEQFDRYIDREPAALTEEAIVSRALALAKLGRRDDERAAWQLLLSKYPTSVHAPRARQRLSELQ